MHTDLVVAGNRRFVAEAEITRLRLEDAGIPAFLSNAELVNADWFYGNATGWVKIMVPEDCLEQARAIVDEEDQLRQAIALRKRDRAAPVKAETTECATCLACGAPLPTGKSQCLSCGWTYKRRPEAAVVEAADAPPPLAADPPTARLLPDTSVRPEPRRRGEAQAGSEGAEDDRERDMERDAVRLSLGTVLTIVLGAIVLFILLAKFRELSGIRRP